MYDSRTDSDLIRRAWRCKPDAEGAFGALGILANREMGEGDRIEWSTPKPRIHATKRAEREAIAEGIEEYLADVEAGLAVLSALEAWREWDGRMSCCNECADIEAHMHELLVADQTEWAWAWYEHGTHLPA